MSDIEKVETNELIKTLGEDLKNPSESKDFAFTYWLSWNILILCLAGIAFVSTIALPKLSFFAEDFTIYQGAETLLWLILSVLTSYCTFAASHPTKNFSAMKWLSFVLLCVSVLWSVSQINFSQSPTLLMEEINPSRGGCGLYIFFGSLLSVTWMSYIVRKAAPVKIYETAFWIAISNVGATMAYMNLVCHQETVYHLLVWHLVTSLLVVSIAAAGAKKFLRW